jgi:hypothetical protein
MDLAIKLTQLNGHYSASLLGDPDVRVEAPTREEAIAGLRERAQAGVNRSEILTIRVEPHPVLDMVGIFKDDPTLREMADEIYRQRNDQRTREHGE